MDADGTSFSFPSASDFNKDQESSDISWGDIFLDGIHSEESPLEKLAAGELDVPSENSGPSVISQQVIQQQHTQQQQQQQQGIMGGQVHIQIPTHLQGTISTNGLQQTSTSISGSVAYLAPSVTTSQLVSSENNFQNVMTAAGQRLVTTSITQQQQNQQTQQQANAKLVQLAAPSFPVASVQQLPNSVPLQTLLQSNPTLTNQTLYRNQSGLFPTQGSVHIENPKVVNVNFGPHVIGSDGSSQQALIQTAEGKPVFITNSQLQQMSQSLNLTQPLVGTQLLNQGGGNVLRTTLAQGQQSVVNQPRQIVLPSGQAVIPRQPDPTAAAKSVVLRQLNPSVSPVIYPGGQGGQLQLQPQSTALITSTGQGLQVVNTAGGQGNQVQLIAQSQLGQGQQQLNQNALVNLLNGQGMLNNGLVQSGQNILVNGQVVNLGQLGGMAIQQQLQLQQQQQQQQQSTNTVSLGQAVVNRPVARQLQQQQLQNQPNTQQPVFLSQNTPGVSVVGNNAQQQLNAQIMLQQQQQKVAVGLGNPLTNIQQQGTFRPGGTLTPNNTGSNCSTPAPTPTPSTPTPTPTPDLMLDPNSGNGGKGGQSSNILEQALTMSDIDLQSFEDDFNLLDECLPSVPAPTAPAPAITPAPAPTPTPTPAKSKPKRQSKKSKAAAQQQQQQPKGQTTTVQNTQGQKVTLTPQQKIIATNGQVYVLSANGQQLILQQPSTTTVTNIAPQLKPIPSQAAPSSVSTTPSRNISTSVSQQRTPQLLLAQNHSVSSGNVRQHQSKIPIIPSKMGFQAQKNVYVSASVQSDNKGYVKTSTDLISNDSGSKISSGKSSVQAEQKSSVPFSSLSTSISGNLPYTCSVQPSNQTLSNQQQVKAQKITTLDGSFVKQEPLTAVVKQEPVASQQQVLPFSSSQSVVPSAPLSGFPAVSQAITSGTSSNIAPISSSLVVSTAMTSTVTTQSHQSTIMITSPSVGTAAGSYATTTSSSNTTTTSKSSNSKEKDPNTIKSMTPIRIANSTLTLSLTPAQKERLEDHLSRMTMREQNEFLAHQQNLNKRIQQVQQEQQQKLLQQQQKQQQQQQQQQSQVSLQQQANHQPAVSATTTAPSPSAVLRLPNQKTNVTQQSQPASSQLLRFKRQQKPAEQNGTTISAALETNGSSAPALLLPKTVEELENEMTECKKNSQPAAPASTQHEQLSQKKGLGQQQQQQQQQQQPTPVPQRQPQQLLTQALQTPQATPAQPGSSQTPVQQQQQQQAVYPQMGICLAEQQLIRDRSLALNPDTNTNFKNLSDAMRRLVRYHTLQDHKPEEDSKTIKTWDAKYSKLSDYLMKKKRYYMRRYNKLRLYHDMCQERRPESLQNLMCFNEQLKELFEAEKEEAKNHPETFQPIRPVERAPSPEEPEPPLFPERQYRIPIASLSREERRASKKAKRKELSNFGSHFKEPQIKEEVTEARTKHEIWESPKPLYSSLKRKCSPETGSSGTLKLVFKRRTTDDFSVKNSVDVAKGLKPVVNLEKSDSEYEFEAGCSSRLSQSVKVRRRTSSQSLASHQSVVDVCSDRSSVHSSNDEASENSLSEEEEDNDNEGDRSASAFNSDEDENEEDDDGEVEEDLVESVNLEHDTSTSGNKSGLGHKGSKRNCHVSFEGDDEDRRAMYNHVEEGAFHEVRNGQRESDAFMETDDSVIAIEPVEKTNCVKETRNLFSSVFKFSDISSGSLSSVKKLGRSFSKSASVTSVASDDVFTSASTPDCVPGAEAVSACRPLNLGALQAISTGPSVTADTASVSQASLLHHHSTFQPMDSLQSPPLRSTRKSDVSSALTVLSSVSNMEKEAASQGLPASSILNTPSKSLLQTDAMFNSSDDDDDDDDNILGSSQSRLVNRFKIDNRDPQSSMINDSVRSAINRALIDNDDSNGPEGEDSQASWSSAQRAPSSASSSVAHNGIFRLSSSPTLHPTHDTDLDAAVQSIING